MRYGTLLLLLFAMPALRAEPAPLMGAGVNHPERDLPELFRWARELAPDKAADLDKLEAAWIPKWMRQKTEVRIAEFTLQRVLQDPESSEKDLARALDRLQEEKTRLFRIEKDALLALHRTLGSEAFARLMKEPPFVLRIRGMKRRFFPDVEDIEMEVQKFMEGLKETSPSE